MLQRISNRTAHVAQGRRQAVRCLSGSIDATSLKGRSLNCLTRWSAAEIRTVLDMSHALKDKMKVRGEIYQPLVGKTMAMIFMKRSTRTRVSTETGIAQLGGHALFLGMDDVQLGVNESLLDTSRVLSGFNDIVLARVDEHDTIDTLEREASVPIINALSDFSHPLQLLADMHTIEERFGSLEGKTVAWVGDGNNILHSLLHAGPKMGMNVRAACPAGYEPLDAPVAAAQADAAASGAEVFLTTDPKEAVAGADIVMTDTWVSMGQEEEKKERLSSFAGYQVTEELCAGANRDWAFMHCLPRKPEEVDDEVFYGERSIVWSEAENRKWTVMATTLALLQGGMDR